MQRILLVEDHASFRQTLAILFEREPEFEVVGQAGTLAEARRVLRHVEADMAVVDLSLPDGQGVELIEELGEEAGPNLTALVLTASVDRADHARAVEAGAAGVLHKSADVDEIINAARLLAAGESLLSHGEITDLLRLAVRNREHELKVKSAAEQLTRREMEVLQALSEGLSNKEIAGLMHISVETERSHMMNILTKLGARSRLQALVVAARHGIVDIH
ncbi:MAG: response regulator [Rubrobacteraceae bacterium]